MQGLYVLSDRDAPAAGPGAWTHAVAIKPRGSIVERAWPVGHGLTRCCPASRRRRRRGDKMRLNRCHCSSDGKFHGSSALGVGGHGMAKRTLSVRGRNPLCAGSVLRTVRLWSCPAPKSPLGRTTTLDVVSLAGSPQPVSGGKTGHLPPGLRVLTLALTHGTVEIAAEPSTLEQQVLHGGPQA